MINTIILTTLLLIVLIIVITAISKYNHLKSSRNQIDNALSSLDALFIKRKELIPNLVAVVKQYTSYENDLLEKLTNLRQQTTPSRTTSNEEETHLLKKLMIQVENYPELKASSQFTNLQYSLNECEEQIAAGRRYLSASITIYNDAVATFPSNLIANVYAMHPYEWERAKEEQRTNVDVKDLMK